MPSLSLTFRISDDGYRASKRFVAEPKGFVRFGERGLRTLPNELRRNPCLKEGASPAITQ